MSFKAMVATKNIIKLVRATEAFATHKAVPSEAIRDFTEVFESMNMKHLVEFSLQRFHRRHPEIRINNHWLTQPDELPDYDATYPDSWYLVKIITLGRQWKGASNGEQESFIERQLTQFVRYQSREEIWERLVDACEGMSM